MKKNWIQLLVIAIFSLVYLVGCGTVSKETGSANYVQGGATISGQVVASSSDISLSGLGIKSVIPVRFRTLATSGVSQTQVALYAVDAAGQSTDTGKRATSDAQGNYTFSDVPALENGVYKIVAEKKINGASDTFNVETYAAVGSANVVANLSPETEIACSMLDKVLREKFAKLNIQQDTLEELINLVVDDVEKMVTSGNIKLPSMKISNETQVKFAAEGIAENNGNSEKAFQKLEFEQLAYNALDSQDQDMAIKVIRDVMVASLGSETELPPYDELRAFAKAFLAGNSFTFSEVITRMNESMRLRQGSGSPAQLNLTQQLNSFQSDLADLETNYQWLKNGNGSGTLNDLLYYVFNENFRTTSVNASTTLNMAQVIVLSERIWKASQMNPQFNTTQFDHMRFANSLGLLSGLPDMAISRPFFSNYELYFAYYAHVDVIARASLFIPTSSVSVISVTLIDPNSVSHTMTTSNLGNGSVYAIDSNLDIVAISGNYIFRAVLSDSTIVTRSVSLTVYDIPGPQLMKLDGTNLQNQNNVLTYAAIPTIDSKTAIYRWSDDPLPVGAPSDYSYGYIFDVNGSVAVTDNGVLKILAQNPFINNDYYRYQASADNIYKNTSFISPVTMAEKDGSGQYIAYRFHLQRVLLDDKGRWVGWAAGSDAWIRYTP